MQFAADAVTELREGAGRGEDMSCWVRRAIMLGWFLQAYYIYVCCSVGCTARGFTWMTVIVYAIFCLVCYYWIPTVLFICKLLKFALRTFASPTVRDYVRPFGEPLCQSFFGFIWTLHMALWWSKWKEASWCMRRKNCYRTSGLFYHYELMVSAICPRGSTVCEDVGYNLHWFVPLLFAYVINEHLILPLWNVNTPPPPSPERTSSPQSSSKNTTDKASNPGPGSSVRPPQSPVLCTNPDCPNSGPDGIWVQRGQGWACSNPKCEFYGPPRPGAPLDFEVCRSNTEAHITKTIKEMVKDGKIKLDRSSRSCEKKPPRRKCRSKSSGRRGRK